MNEGQYRYIKALLECLDVPKEKFEKLELEKESMSEERASDNIKSLLKRIKKKK